MASSSISACFFSSHKYYTHQSLQVRAHFSKDHEGGSRNISDAKLRILKERIEKIRVREGLEKCWISDKKYGWNYGYEPTKVTQGHINYKREEISVFNYIKLIKFVRWPSGFIVLGGTAFLTIFSLISHLNQ